MIVQELVSVFRPCSPAGRGTFQAKEKKEIKKSLTKRVEWMTSVPAWGIQSYKAGIEGGACRGADVLLSGGTDMLSDSGTLRNLRGAGPMCVGGTFQAMPFWCRVSP
jgi:hypothetical protein